MTATITGPKGDLQHCDLLPFNPETDVNSNMFILKFLPCIQGNDAKLARKPLPIVCFFTFFDLT